MNISEVDLDRVCIPQDSKHDKPIHIQYRRRIVKPTFLAELQIICSWGPLNNVQIKGEAEIDQQHLIVLPDKAPSLK